MTDTFPNSIRWSKHEASMDIALKCGKDDGAARGTHKLIKLLTVETYNETLLSCINRDFALNDARSQILNKILKSSACPTDGFLVPRKNNWPGRIREWLASFRDEVLGNMVLYGRKLVVLGPLLNIGIVFALDTINGYSYRRSL